MGTILENYPMINETVLSNLSIINNFRLHYTTEEKISNLEYTNIDDTYEAYYVDSSGTWNPINNDLNCFGRLSISNVNTLFNECPIASHDTILGVAITVYCKLSKVNFTKSIGEIKYNQYNDILNFDYNFYFPSKSLSQSINVEFSVYVKECNSTTGPFAKIKGSNLGIIKSFELKIEGSGSIFPIKIVEDINKPLWSMNINYDDLNDDFSIQSVCIKINKSHNDFKYLGSEAIDANNYYLWKEVLAGFFTNILLYSKDDFDSLEENEYKEGSMGNFINYIISNFQISKSDISNPIILSEKIRLFLDKIITK